MNENFYLINSNEDFVKFYKGTTLLNKLKDKSTLNSLIQIDKQLKLLNINLKFDGINLSKFDFDLIIGKLFLNNYKFLGVLVLVELRFVYILTYTNMS